MTQLYVHIPFCHSKCAYCDFFSTPKLDTMERLIDAIIAHWRMLDHRSELSTLYLGGGTPSILPAHLLGKLVAAFGRRPWREATIECNPEDVTPEFVELVRQLGFNRVSMGVQTLDDATLRLIGRRHDSVQAFEAMRMLIDSGLLTSFDLIYGLPNQSLDQWEYNLDTMLALRPHHLSAYLLSYEHGTRLWAMREAGKVAEADEATVEEMYNLLCQKAREYGYEHYEVSNFALPGHRAMHNSGYWNNTPYIGLGPGAHSCYNGARSHNPSSIVHYIDTVARGELPSVADEETATDCVNDTIITTLRTSDGLNTVGFERRHGQAPLRQLHADAARLVSSGLLTFTEGTYTIPEKHLLISDSILRTLLQ